MASLLNELLHEAHDDEALVARDRAVLLDFDFVAGEVFVFRVVRFVAGARADVFAVERIAGVRDDFDDDRLVHAAASVLLVGADDSANHLATEAVRVVLFRDGRFLSLRGHFFSVFVFFGAAAFFAGFDSVAGGAAFFFATAGFDAAAFGVGFSSATTGDFCV